MASSSDASAPPAVPATTAGPASAGSVSFKAYLVEKGQDKPQEVRRFGMEQNEVTSFDLLKRKIRQVFPGLANHEFTINWKDFEDDDIIISSNEELLTALTETSDQVRRLYIHSKEPIPDLKAKVFQWKPIEVLLDAPLDAEPLIEPESDEEEEEDNIVFTAPGNKRTWHSALRPPTVKYHPSVYCDGCERHIYGHRYKCLECDDFDLCHDCESQLMHKEHIMLRIPLTDSHYTKLNNFSKSMRHMMDTLHKIDHRVKKQARRMNKIYEADGLEVMCLADEVLRANKRCKRDLKEEKKDKKDKKDKQDKRDKKDKYYSCSAGTSAPRPNCRASAPESASNSESCDQSTPASGGCPFPTGFLNSILNSQALGNLLHPQNLQNLQQFFDHISPMPEQLLQEVAQNLADVRLNDSTPASSAAPSTPPPNPFSKKGTETSDGPARSSPTSTQETTSQEKQDAAKVAASVPQGSESVAAAVQVVASATSSGAASTPASTPSGAADQLKIPQQTDIGFIDLTNWPSGSSRSSSEEADNEPGWTVIDGQLDAEFAYPKLPQVEPTPVPHSSVAPTPVPVLAGPLHPDPDVNRCLRDLAEMGYNARDEMIVDLAIEYKGNVSRVLNVLLS